VHLQSILFDRLTRDFIMSTLFEMAAKGGIVMIPMAVLSVATVAAMLDRLVFWITLYRTEDQTAHRILEAARYSISDANQLAKEAGSQPIARFMHASLKMINPTPESFRLAMETASEHEFEQMSKGDKLLETSVALAPLFRIARDGDGDDGDVLWFGRGWPWRCRYREGCKWNWRGPDVHGGGDGGCDYCDDCAAGMCVL
jgi:hypothetical protein